jgi:hypothetical protein
LVIEWIGLQEQIKETKKAKGLQSFLNKLHDSQVGCWLLVVGCWCADAAMADAGDCGMCDLNSISLLLNSKNNVYLPRCFGTCCGAVFRMQQVLDTFLFACSRKETLELTLSVKIALCSSN